MINNIPEDFNLRRHYLTELKYKQQENFESFIHATECSQPVIEPSSNRFLVITTALVIFGLLILI